MTTSLRRYATHVLLAHESNKAPMQASNFHRHLWKEKEKKKEKNREQRDKRKKKRRNRKRERGKKNYMTLPLSVFSPYEIKFPCGTCIWCTAWWFIKDAKSMQKQSLLHPFPACQLRSCWLFIKELMQVRGIYLDTLIDCPLPHCDSRWMDWAAGKMKKSADSKALLSDIFLHRQPCHFS